MGLTEPLIPQYSNTGVQNFLAGFTAVAAANHKREQENLLAQRLVEKRQMDEQNFLLKSQMAADNFSLRQVQAEAAQTRAAAYAEHIGHELEKEKKTVADLGPMSDELAAAKAKYPMGSRGLVQAIEAIQSKYHDAAGDVHGNRILGPQYAQATRDYNSQHTRFRQDNQDIFGHSTSDPWSNNPAWTQDTEGPTKGQWRFPVWEYATVQQTDPKTGQVSVVSKPVHKKDVVMSDADKKNMQSRYDQYIRGDDSLPSPKSDLPSSGNEDVIKEAAARARQAITNNYGEAGVRAKFKNTYGVDLDSVQ